jgi:hypothetical protein
MRAVLEQGENKRLACSHSGEWFPTIRDASHHALEWIKEKSQAWLLEGANRSRRSMQQEEERMIRQKM